MRGVSFGVLLGLLCLLSTSVLAQSVGDKRTEIAGKRLDDKATTARFAVGLTRDKGVTFRDQARSSDEIRIAIRVVPETVHINHLGDVFVLVFIGDTPHMITASGQLLPWNGELTALQPFLSKVTLTASMNLDVFTGVVGNLGAFPFFVAYQDTPSGDFVYTPSGTSLTLTNEKSPTESISCSTYGGRTVQVGYRNSTQVFTHTPFNASDLALITNGIETNDSRFAYTWIKKQGTKIDIYAPADGVLIRMRHKAENLPDFPSDDFDLFFLVACDPNAPQNQTIVRFNHITDPRPDIKAAYAFGALGAPVFNPFDEHEERQVPTVNIAVKAGDYIGSTSGTPVARNFDFQIGINDVTVCPFSVLEEPHRSRLLGLLGPQANSPAGPPVANFSCQGYGGRP